MQGHWGRAEATGRADRHPNEVPQGSGCNVRMRLWPRLLPTTFIACYPRWWPPVHSGPLTCSGLSLPEWLGCGCSDSTGSGVHPGQGSLLIWARIRWPHSGHPGHAHLVLRLKTSVGTGCWLRCVGGGWGFPSSSASLAGDRSRLCWASTGLCQICIPPPFPPNTPSSPRWVVTSTPPRSHRTGSTSLKTPKGVKQPKTFRRQVPHDC